MAHPQTHRLPPEARAALRVLIAYLADNPAPARPIVPPRREPFGNIALGDKLQRLATLRPFAIRVVIEPLVDELLRDAARESAAEEVS